ncbi:PREDICTED: protein phosphatase 1 regulatory subunit 42-like isoform X2 [Priapulus caudatus]|uniref:Protein phosphatase 1 regulatory subunit 42-like isoform X2 n=1 Tax=Priapulus caudatus TaxID=37621 RepID=A0ABM1EUT5_PRICU|nr:PREDICTED: protein phosphatase 1 regulatory subunit 42-like isoform X2 [Priapulus caudatus]
MVHLTTDVISKGLLLRHQKWSSDEEKEKLLSKLTHIYAHGKNIDVIDPIPECRNVSVIYLYDNSINCLENLQHFDSKLTHLYLHDNKLSKIDNLSTLRHLKKLYLGYNQITVVEGLENLTNLTELHVESQRLAPGETLLLDPRSLRAIASLQVLNLAGDQLQAISDLAVLSCLTQLLAAHNDLADLRSVTDVVTQLPCLRVLHLEGNPVCRQKKYRESIIVAGDALESLDDKEVTTTSRQFLKNWVANKEMQKSRADLVRRNTLPALNYDGHSYEGSLPKFTTSKGSVLGGSSSYMMPAFPSRQRDSVLIRSAQSARKAHGSFSMDPSVFRFGGDLTKEPGICQSEGVL